MSRKTFDFKKNVFINCPFDRYYTPLFHAIVFTVCDVGFKPRCAWEVSNSAQNRLSKIMDIISECKYSIHDLSRTELDSPSALPRFNMPFELGLDLGCRRYGNSKLNEKVCLVMDVERYRYQTFISDISGQDIEAHNGNTKQVIEHVRNLLRQELDPRTTMVPSGIKIFQRYQKFQKALPAICCKLNWNFKQLPFNDYSYAVAAWIDENPT